MPASLGKKLEIPFKNPSKGAPERGREDYRTQYTVFPAP